MTKRRSTWFVIGLLLGSILLGGLWLRAESRRVPPPLDPAVAEELRRQGFEEGRMVAPETIVEYVEVPVEVPGPERVRVVEVVRGGVVPDGGMPSPPPAPPSDPGPPPPVECPACTGFLGLRPADLGGDCQAEIVESGGQRWARLWLTSTAHQWPVAWDPDTEPTVVTRGPIRVGRIEFLQDEDVAPVQRSRWRATALLGLTTAPGWYVGASWQRCSRWGLFASVRGAFDEQEESVTYFDSGQDRDRTLTAALDRYEIASGVTFSVGSRPAGCYRN